MGEDKYRDEVAIISIPSRSQRYNDDHMVALEVEVPETLHQVGTGSLFDLSLCFISSFVFPFLFFFFLLSALLIRS